MVWVLKTSDLVLKEIHGILKTEDPTKQQINDCKMTEREIYEKFGNLGEEELNTKSHKNIYVRNDVMTTIIKCCRGEIRAIDGFRKKLLIPDTEIPNYLKFEVKSKKGKLFMNEKKIFLKNILLRFMKLILIFMRIVKKK